MAALVDDTLALPVVPTQEEVLRGEMILSHVAVHSLGLPKPYGPGAGD